MLFNQRAVKFCQYYGIPWIITNDVHYLTRDRRSLHEIYLKSHEEEREAGDFYESTYFKTPDEMRQRLDYLPPDVVEQGFANTVLIADMCKDAGDYGLFCGTIVPKRKLPAFTVSGSLDVDAEMMRDWARIMDIEFVYINKDSKSEKLEQELLLNDLAWKLR